MKFLSQFNSFTINEATLNDTKIGIDYMLSRPGRNAIDKFEITEDVTLTYTTDRPKADDIVMWLKASSIIDYKFSELKKVLGDDLMIYKTSSKKMPWAVAKKGLITTMVKQLVKEGSSKRGNHFRETAFIITLAIEAWRMRGIKLNVASNRGFIEMDYKKNGSASISESERASFRNEYIEFMDSTPSNIREQCVMLVEYLGKKISTISFVVKNTNDLMINQMATNYLKDEIDNNEYKDVTSFEIPSRSSISKWNPSDIWLIYKGFEWSINDEGKYEENNIDDLSSLNDMLMDSILNKSGVIGISLKQSEGEPVLTTVNLDPDKATYKYDNFTVLGDKKTVIIDFSYKFRNGQFNDGGEIQCRTFDTSNTSTISMEVKGSRLSKYMSGKAGSILNTLMSDKYCDIKEYVRTETNKGKISKYLDDVRFKFRNKDLGGIFYDDVNNGRVKTSDQNSRMQSIIIIEWLESLPVEEADNIISKIVSFAKSENDWSAPHLLVK